MPLAPNSRLGRYEIRSKLGEGGMGEVYSARDPKLGRDVAVKVLPQQFSADKERLARFEQEACAAGALNHPNILSVHDIGTEQGSPYVVSELLEGVTLREKLRGAPLPQRKALDYATQIARGLSAAHERGIVHRDLKPENVFITTDGRAKILDFGLAKLTQPDGEGAHSEVPTRRVDTDPGAVMGTVGYMAPEQVRGRKVDHRADVFAFGAVLYEMLAGRRAFRGESAADTLSAILKEDPPDLSESNRSVPPALERLVLHCLEKNPAARFQSAGDLAFALEALSGSNAVSGSSATIPVPIPARPKNRERLGWIALSGVLFLSALVFAALYYRRPPAEEARVVRLTIPPPEKGQVGLLSVSPDGRRVVYGAPSAEGGPDVLWLRPLDSPAAQPLPGTENPFFTLFWSPDSRSVAFVSRGELKKIDVTGGPPQTIAPAPNGRGGAWNRDGVILFAPDASGPLYRVSASRGEATPATALDGSRNEVSHRFPHFLPDGRHFLYLATSPREGDFTLCVGALDSKETKRLVSADSGAMYAAPGYLLFLREGALVAQGFDADRLELRGEAVPIAEGVGLDVSSGLARFSVSENGVLVYHGGGGFDKVQLTWFDRGGKQAGTVGPPGVYRFLRLSPDGKRAALAQRDPQTKSFDIWLMEMAGGNLKRLTFDPANELFPVWSPDGTRVAFASDRDGQTSLYQKLSSGAGDEDALLRSDRGNIPTDWSPDGRFIAYRHRAAKTRSDIWVLPLDGDRQPFPFVQTPGGEEGSRFSPDGRWVAYTSDVKGVREVYVQSFPAGRGTWQISQGGGFLVEWRGRELFYTSQGKVMAVEVKAGAETFEAGAPTALFENRAIALRGPVTGVDTADGQRFLVAVPVEEATSTPISVVLNWAAGLKR